MIRRMVIRPDKVMVTADGEGELLTVSREAMREAMLDLESQLAFSGGVGAITVQRAPTGIDGEMVTVAAILEWKDAPIARPKPEPVAHWEEIVEEAAAEAPQPEQPPQPKPTPPPPAAEMPFPGEEEPVEAADVIYGADGDPDEDISAIPEDKRALAR